jgi:2-hydroxychromene-2-carboxylate isomerase
MSELRFYYDFSCPWSYLALVRLQDVADRNATTIELRPISVDQVLATENPPLQAHRLSNNPAKAAWQRKDLADWARLWALTLELPNGWPCDATLAAAAASIAADRGAGLAYSLKTFAAYFGAGNDISNPEVLGDLAAETGLDRADFLLQLGSDEPAQKITDWTEELIRQGGFGTPSVFVGDELFFGNDRIPLVDWTIGPLSSDEFLMPGQHG